MCDYGLAQLLSAKKLAPPILCFRHAIAVNNKAVTRRHLSLLDCEFGLRQKPHGHGCSLQILNTAALRYENGGALASVDITQTAGAVKQAVKNGGVLAALCPLV